MDLKEDEKQDLTNKILDTVGHLEPQKTEKTRQILKPNQAVTGPQASRPMGCRTINRLFGKDGQVNYRREL